MRVSVIGAGILGSALGYRLARSGVDTTIVDGDHEPSRASWASFAWLNANGKQPSSYFELNRAGIRAGAELADELGDGRWLHPVGSIELAAPTEAAELLSRAERQAAAGYRSERLDPGALTIVEPSLAVDPALVGAAVLFHDEGWLDTAGLITLLRAHAVAGGARVRLGSPLTVIESGDLARLRTSDGESWEADVVVNAAGASAGEISALAGGCLPSTSGTLGLTAVTAVSSAAPGRVIRWPGGTARAHPGGGVMVASTSSVDKRLLDARDTQLDGALAREAINLAASYMPGLAGAAVASVRVAKRAVPPDSLPVVGPDPGVSWLYHLVSHSGVTLAALLSRLSADEIVDGRTDERLTAYRPYRFAR